MIEEIKQIPPSTLMDEIFSKTIENSQGCWLWTGSCFPSGYPQKKVDKKNWRVHRLVYTLLGNSIPENHVVRHLCGCRRCLNPIHLSSGTLEENSKDSLVHGTRYLSNTDQTGSNNHMATLTEDEVYFLRLEYLKNISMEKLAVQLGKSRKVVERAIRGKTYCDFNIVPPVKDSNPKDRYKRKKK